jgi:hypothetical protein
MTFMTMTMVLDLGGHVPLNVYTYRLMSTPRRCGPDIPPFGSTGGAVWSRGGVHNHGTMAPYMYDTIHPSMMACWINSMMGIRHEGMDTGQQVGLMG